MLIYDVTLSDPYFAVTLFGGVTGSTNSLKGQNIFNKSLQIYYVTYVSEAYFLQDDDVAWWVDSGANVHVCKDRCWFKTYEPLNDESILYMGNKSTTLVHGHGCVDLRFSFGKIDICLNVWIFLNIKERIWLNIVNDNIGSAFMSTSKLNDSILWHARLGHVHFKRMQDMSKDGLIPAFDMDTEKLICVICMLLLHSGNKKYFVTFIDYASRAESRVLGAVVRLPDPKLKTLGERGIECIFIGYAEHSKAFRFSSVPRPSQRSVVKGTEDSGGSVVPKKVTEEVVQQPELKLRKSKRHRTPKDFGPEFQLYLIKGTKDEDVAFWKEAINDEMDFIMDNNTWVLVDLPPDYILVAFKLNELLLKLEYEHIQRISLIGFPAQSIGSSNTYLDSPCLLVLITGTSQSRQHVITSLIHIESCKSPTAELFEVDSGRISIRHCEY
ncbi:zinc finger, CCHC-type containing protein [Tanacetum coccineum]